MGSTFAQLREGIEFIRANRSIGWSLLYLGIAASLVGVLGVLGPQFAQDSLGLQPEDFAVVVLPLGFGIVTGILILNSFGHLVPAPAAHRGRASWRSGSSSSLIVLAGPISRAIHRCRGRRPGIGSMSSLTSLLAVVVFIALLAGIAYAFVAIPAQTQLQEDIPEEGRGRVFGILNMLVSVSSFLPIIIVGPVSDVFGTTAVLLGVAIAISVSGILSIVVRGPLNPQEAASHVDGTRDAGRPRPGGRRAAASEVEAGGRRAARSAESAAAASATAVAIAAPPDEADGSATDGAAGVDVPEPPFQPTPDEHE